MKDEIKEILNNPKILMLSYGNYISLDDYVKLKDYITNLQEIERRHEKAIERLTLKGDIQEKDVIEVFANAIKETINILQGKSDE